MALRFYTNYIDNIAKVPNDTYVDNTQALFNEQFINSTQRYFVEEETDIGTGVYEQVEVQVASVIDSTTGMKQTDDFKSFIFKDLSHETALGLMYKFEDNNWIIYNTSDIASVTKSVNVRRCNNVLRWIDRENGNLYEYPCVIDYDVSSPRPLKDKEIITANNHVVLIFQANDVTRNIKANQRFIFNGRPFKITGYNNVMQNGIVDFNTTILYMDAYLDTIQPTDDIVNNIANLYELQYSIVLNQDVKEQVLGYKGRILADVNLNGVDIEKEIIWTSNEFAIVDAMGQYELIGNVGDIAKIYATIKGNSSIMAVANIKIAQSVVDKYEILLTPIVDDIKQYQTRVFASDIYKNGVKSYESIKITPLNLDSTYYEIRTTSLCDLETIDGLKLEDYDMMKLIDCESENITTIKCLKPSNEPLKIKLYSALHNVEKIIDIKLLPIF